MQNPCSKVEGGEQAWFSLFPLHGWGGSDLPPQAGHAVHGHAAAGVFAELGLQQVEPIFHYFAGRRRSVIERPILQGGGGQGWGKRETLVRPWGKTQGIAFYSREVAFWTSAVGRRIRVPATGLAAQLPEDVAAIRWGPPISYGQVQPSGALRRPATWFPMSSCLRGPRRPSPASFLIAR